MDIRVFKTFLEVANAKHFGKAAEKLYITQGAVSARIKQLEDYYATKLFIREKNNIRLTSSGERLLTHARSIVDQLANSKLNLRLAEDNQILINIAATSNVWDAYFANSITSIVSRASEYRIGAEISVRESIHRRLVDKTLDIGIVADPIRADELINEKIGNFDLVLATTNSTLMESDEIRNYILVDWGMAFLKEHAVYHRVDPLVRTSTAKVALDLMLEMGGAAYLPIEMVQPYVEQDQLYVVESPLNIKRDIFLTYHKNNALKEHILTLLEKL